MDIDVILDPVFEQLLLKYELEARKLRDAVIAMRSFYLKHHKSPQEETTSEKWRGAILSEFACEKHLAVQDAAADLLRYGFEICPKNSSAIHLEELYKLKLAHRERLERRSGWAKPKPGPKGIEEQVKIDEGPPVTVVIQPQHYDFTARAQRRAISAKPAIEPPAEDGSTSDPIDVDTGE
jgi:hypothetical protein